MAQVDALLLSQLSYYSNLAYKSTSTITSELTGIGFNWVEPYVNLANQAFAAADANGNLIISFRALTIFLTKFKTSRFRHLLMKPIRDSPHFSLR